MISRPHSALARLVLVAVCAVAAAVQVQAQSSGVPVYKSREADKAVSDAAVKLREAGRLVPDSVLTNQLGRLTCTIELPAPKRRSMDGRDLWAAARAAHLRLGWHYLCSKCDQWHINLAGGYAVTENGVVATCRHVVEKPENFKEGFLVAADDTDRVFAVTEILASNAFSDVCLVKLDARGLKPLPLTTEVRPGDRAFCFSWPLGQRGYFSEGMVNRFISRTQRRAGETTTRINVSTDWAPGSSGSAILDERGNAIGHVVSISPMTGGPRSPKGGGEKRQPDGPQITLHEAASAADVLKLVEPTSRPSKRK